MLIILQVSGDELIADMRPSLWLYFCFLIMGWLGICITIKHVDLTDPENLAEAIAENKLTLKTPAT